MTAEDVFSKMERLRVTREELARKAGFFPNTLTDFRKGRFTMSAGDAKRLSLLCDEIVKERLHRREVVAV